jgi:hypothetical protein
MHRDPLLISKEQPPLERPTSTEKAYFKKKGPPWEKKQELVALA